MLDERMREIEDKKSSLKNMIKERDIIQAQQFVEVTMRAIWVIQDLLEEQCTEDQQQVFLIKPSPQKEKPQQTPQYKRGASPQSSKLERLADIADKRSTLEPSNQEKDARLEASNSKQQSVVDTAASSNDVQKVLTYEQAHSLRKSIASIMDTQRSMKAPRKKGGARRNNNLPPLPVPSNGSLNANAQNRMARTMLNFQAPWNLEENEEDRLLNEILIDQDRAAVTIQQHLRQHLAVRQVHQLREDLKQAQLLEEMKELVIKEEQAAAKILRGELPFDPSLTDVSPFVMQQRTRYGPFFKTEEPEGLAEGRVLKLEPVTLEDWTTYIGEWARRDEFESAFRIREGWGVRIWADGSIYEGWFRQDRASGMGRLIHADGYSYEGPWEADMASGQNGIYRHSDGTEYQGSFMQDKQHGYGVETWPDGVKYSGQYHLGKKHGRGKFEWPDGNTYDGDFVDNLFEGTGQYTWGDGRSYYGDWRENKMEGFGTFTWPDGRRYLGEYKADQKHGHGTFFWPDFRIYEGEWSQGRQHGEGYYTMGAGQERRKGLWKHGKRVQWID
ncbi:hypothetical protein FGO68_gene11675 [Halteria grandinella]|uniref:Uncharacterized protein n=1 Tax=Halteria grandinella TaxID=5974 RepID=A0A8J8SW89_HALGN|nr:hypothetical protein FGO68_gene11675 [Halteria grandinella]